MPEYIPTKNIPLSTVPVKSTIGTPVGNTGYGTSKYDYPVNYQDALYNLEEFRHNNQSNMDVLGNSLMHFTGSAVNAALEIPAIAFGMLKVPFVQIDALSDGKSVLNAAGTGLSEIYDNEISRQVVDPINNWFQDTFKVYQSQAQKDSNFFSYENLTSGHFLDALLSGAGYTAGSYVTGIALTKAFGLGKIAASGTKVKSAEEALSQASSIASRVLPIDIKSQIVLGTTMAAMESSLEARQTKDQILQSLKDRSDLSDAQKEEIANTGSLANFAFNMGILAPTNSLLFGKLIRPNSSSIESGINTVLKDGKVVEKVGSKYWERFKKIKNPITEGIFTEGSQEYLQFASNEAITDYINKREHGKEASVLESIGTALYNGLATKEGLENTVIGGLIGGIFGSADHLRNAKADKERKQAQLAFINTQLPFIFKEIQDKLLDANRTISYQKNADNSIADKEKFDYYNNKHSTLVSLVQQNMQAGTLGLLIDRINSIQGASKEEINQVFGNQITQADLNAWDSDESIKSLVQEIKDIKKTQENVQRILPNPHSQKENPVEFTTFRELQNVFAHTASSLNNTNKRILQLNTELIAQGLIPFDTTFYNSSTKEEKQSLIDNYKKEIKDHVKVEEQPEVLKKLDDILKLNLRKEVFTKAYNDLNTKKGAEEALSKIKDKEKPIDKPEEKPKEEKVEIKSTPPEPVTQDEFNIVIEKRGVLGNAIKVKRQPDGSYIDPQGNIYKPEDDYYEPAKTSITKGAREELFGVQHFNRFWKAGLADKSGLGRDINALIQKIAKLSNWKDYIFATVSKKQVNLNIKEDRQPFNLNGKDKLKGQYKKDVDILLTLIDPETGEQISDITGIYPPDFYFLNDTTVDIGNMSYTEFNKYFSNQGQKDFTEKEFLSIQASWKALKQFNDAVVKWYSTQNQEEATLPKDALNYLLSGRLFTDKATPLDSPVFGDVFKDSPIVLGTNPTVSTNGKSLEGVTADLAYDLAFQIDEKFRKSYFVLAKLVNGIQRWIRIIPKGSPVENVLSKLKSVQSKINSLQTEITKEQADAIIDELDFWIASERGKVIKFVHNIKLTGKLQLALGYGTNFKVTDRIILPDISEWTEEDLIKFINSTLKPKGFKDISISNFKQEVEPNNTNIEEFEVEVHPEILKDYTLLFEFNPGVLNQSTELQTEETPEEIIKTEKTEVNTASEEELKYPEELQAKIILARMAGYDENEIQELIKDWYKSNDDFNKTKMYSDESQLSTQPKTYEEIIKRLREQIPNSIGIDRLDRIISTLNLNGIPVSIFRDTIVYISEKMGYSDADHEAFHTIFNTVLSPQEQERYLKAKKRELNYTPAELQAEVNQMLSERPDLIQLLKLKQITRQDVENLVIEEKLADDYADKRNNKELNQPKSWKQIIFNLFDSIIRFFTSEVKILDLFESIDRGAFVNSKINTPNKISTLVKAKLIGGLTSEQSRNLIALITAKYSDIKNKSSLSEIVDTLIKEYDPFSPENLALVQSRNTEQEKTKLKKFLRTYNFALSNKKDLIISESTKYLKYLNYNPKQDEEDDIDIDTDKDMKEYDRLDSEIPTLDRVPKEIKAFIGSALYKANYYGKEIETAIYFSEVYNKLLNILSAVPQEQVLSTIKALGTRDVQINALYNKLHLEKGYSNESPKGFTFDDEMFLTRFVKQFELAKIPYVSVFDTGDKYAVKKTNKNDAGKYTFDQFSTKFNTQIQDKLARDSEFRNELQYNLTLLIAKLQNLPISDKWKYKTWKKSTSIKDILSSIGIDLNKEYLEVLFDNTDEDSGILKDLITKENRNITVQDIYALQNIVFNNTSDSAEGKNNRNPFLDSGMSERLLAISNGSSQFDTNFIIPNYKAADNTPRYTYVPYSYYSQSIEEIKNTYQYIKDLPVKRSEYLSYTPIFNSSNKQAVLQAIQNLELFYIGDSTFETGKTYKDSDEQDVLRVLWGLFQNMDASTQTYITAPSIIADKRSFYGVQVPYKSLYQDGKLTDTAKDLFKGLFTQEFKRLNGDFPNTKSNIFLYLPVFNGTDILDKIKNTSDINTYFESDILPVIEQFIHSEVQNFSIQGLELDTNTVYNFILNNLMNNISIQQLTEGDLSQLNYKDLGTWQKSYNKIFSERFKRESSLNASGHNMGQGEDKIQYTEDTEAWVNIETGQVQWDKPEGEKAKNFHKKSINPDDAQVWQTPLGRLRDMESLGKLTLEHYTALEKLNGFSFDKNGNPEYPTKEELKNLDLISSKHVVSGFDSEGNRVYYKMSISPLIPWDLGYWSVVDKVWKPKKGFEEGFNRWKLMNDNNLDLLVPKSASKVFSGEIGKTYSVPRKYRREQVLKESKESNKVPWLTQIQQLIDFGLLDNKKNNLLRSTLQDIQVQLRNNTFEFLKNQIVDSNTKLKPNIEFFLQKLRDVIEESTPDIQSIELLKSTFGKLDYTLNLAHTKNKMEQIFLSHFKEGFQHKLNGAKLTMRSPIVYRAIRDEKGNVIPGEERNSEKYKDYPESDLKVTWENSEPLGEIVISAFTAKKLGLKIGDTVVSLRVPTQGYNFMGNSKIVDILPEYYGDIVIAAPQLTLYAGQDFDDDALYIFSKERYQNLRGEIMYGEEENLKEKWEGYKNWYINNNQDFRKYLKNLVDAHKELQGLQVIDKILGTSNQTAVQIYDSLVHDTLKFFNLPSSITEYQLKGEPLSQGALNNQLISTIQEIMQQPELEKYFKQASTTDETKRTKERIEKILGTDSITLNMFTPNGLMKAWNDNTASTNLRGSTVLAQTTGANLTKNRVDLNPEFWITFNGITYKSFNTPDDVTYKKNNYSSEKVSTSIDNSKEPMAGTFHWTRNNVSVFSYLNQLGIGIENGDGILAVQPSIIEASKAKNYMVPIIINNWRFKLRNLIKESHDRKEDIANDLDKLFDNSLTLSLTSEDLWNSLKLKDSENIEDKVKFYITQIKALELYEKASQIASYGFHISRLNTLTRTIGSSFNSARSFLESYYELTTTKYDKKGNPIPVPFDTFKLFQNEKNIVNNVRNLEQVLQVAKELFISETDLTRDIQDTLLKSLKAKKKGVTEKVENSLNTYLQVQIYKILNPKVDFIGLITDQLKGSKQENLITSKFKHLMQYPEFSENKFIKFLVPLNLGDKTNTTPLSILKFDSITVPTKELSELFLDSVLSLYNSENPEITKFAEDLLNYQVALNNMEFRNNSFMRFIPVQLLKNLAKKFQELNTEFAKDSINEDAVVKLTGKTSEQLKDEFIINYLSNLNNTYDINSIPKKYKSLIQKYKYSIGVSGHEYMKPWVLSPEGNKSLSDWLNKLVPKVDKSTPEPKESDSVSENLYEKEEIPEDSNDLENPENFSTLEENKEDDYDNLPTCVVI